MCSEKQRLANQANAQKSTGPSPESRAHTRMNALRHGAYAFELMAPGENHLEFQALIEELCAEWRPETPSEGIEIEKMALARWLERRYQRMIAGYIAFFEEHRTRQQANVMHAMAKLGEEMSERDQQWLEFLDARLEQINHMPGLLTAQALLSDMPKTQHPGMLDRLTRQAERASKQYYQAVQMLKKLQEGRLAMYDEDEETPDKVVPITQIASGNVSSPTVLHADQDTAGMEAMPAEDTGAGQGTSSDMPHTMISAAMDLVLGKKKRRE